MVRLYCLIGCVALLALSLAPAAAEVPTARMAGMGDIQISFNPIWTGNPALLAGQPAVESNTTEWSYDADFTAALGSGPVSNAQRVTLGAQNPTGTVGLGAGYMNFMGWREEYGFGKGWKLCRAGLTMGANVRFLDVLGITNVLFDMGFAYRQSLPGYDVAAGAVVRDATDRMGTGLDLGASATWPNGLTAAFDWRDVTGGSNVNVGVEYADGPMAYRAGLLDLSDLTVGLSYKVTDTVEVTAAYQDWGAADAYFGGANINF